MTRVYLSLLILSGALLAGNGWAQAVSVDATSLIRRLDAIETRLTTAEARRPSSSAGVATTGAAYTAADLDRRMEDIETESSQLRGGNDRAMQAIEKLAKRFDDYTKDLDMRMGDLEARVDTLVEKQAAVPAAETPAVAAVAGVATPVAAVSPAAGVAPVVKPSAAAAIPADMSASDHYNKAYAYLTATDYKNAQVWFEEFLKRHAKDPLADNAYYWLGEVYLVQNNPKAAAGKFIDGIKAFPKGNKVTANLFKLGVALEQMKEYPRAKLTWEKLLKDYPTAPEASRAKDKLIQLKAA